VLRITLVGVERAVLQLGTELDDELELAARDISDRVAWAAREDHPYQNRTHNLQGSTTGDAPFGRFLDGDLTANVIASMEYASCVEARGYEFLEPAFYRVEHQLDHVIEERLEYAARRADWR
jgi:hypothetical protein